jgi:hypothetical protein
MLSRYRGLREAGLLVWFFALGYFVSYIPYSALAKAMTQGYLGMGQKPVSGFEILPATFLGTIITMPLLVALGRLVMMRAGVLSIAPVVDAKPGNGSLRCYGPGLSNPTAHRRSHWWAAQTRLPRR